ncbi:Inhibitory POU protein [Chamberlinius hualienensis]
MMNGKPLHGPIGTGTTTCFQGRYSPPYRNADPMRRCMPNHTLSWPFDKPSTVEKDTSWLPDQMKFRPPCGDGFVTSSFGALQSNFFGGLDDGILSRAEALAAVDISKHSVSTNQSLQLKHDMMYHHPPMPSTHPSSNGRSHHQMGHHGPMDSMDLLDPIVSTGMPGVYSTHSMNSMMGSHPLTSHSSVAMHETDADPRELESFAERFKQRRIKLGVTQADVGKALANLKLPGVGALSQSTICRFESLTLSHNNMIALKPILQAWLEEAEAQARNKRKDPDAPDVLPNGEKKRKRTSIAAPEKRSLEAYFAVQPRPSGEKIAAIADKLDLKKNVVRVWFCNQRQKQKRMKFSAVPH